jgi:GTP:adenosylcobinamide-phosphate guanylyltransferase
MADFRVIVLAAQRKGVIDPLATRFGVSHKCLAPLAGEPLIAHVLRTLGGHPGIASVTISVEAEAFAAIETVVPAGVKMPMHCAAAKDNLTDSVFAAAEGHHGPIIITTADNALLESASLDAMMAALANHDVAIAMAPRDAVLAAHPEGQRRFYRFRDDEYSNCNLYGMGSPEALHAAEIFRGGGQFAKKARRIVDAFGLLNLMLLRLRVVTLHQGLKRISRRIRLDIAPVILRDGSQAIDVDNDRTYGVVSEILARRSMSRGSFPGEQARKVA